MTRRLTNPLAKDITGQKFGRLTVLSFAHSNANGRLYWNVRCECGTEKVMRGDGLKNGHAKSCGCLIQENRRKLRVHPSVRIERAIFNQIRSGAKTRTLTFELDEAFVAMAVTADCTYCGTPPSNVMVHPPTARAYYYSGLDRVDSSRGYTEDNVVTCCAKCNVAKSDLELSEFLEWVARVYHKSVRG